MSYLTLARLSRAERRASTLGNILPSWDPCVSAEHFFGLAVQATSPPEVRNPTRLLRVAACTSIAEPQTVKTMADRPNTPVPTLSDIENPIEDGQSPAGASGEDLEAFMLREEERAIASAAAKLTRPTTRLANDVLLLIATRGTARDLGKAQVVSRGWQAAARRSASRGSRPGPCPGPWPCRASR